MKLKSFVFLFILFIFLVGCTEEVVVPSRASVIPTDVIKGTPDNDPYPPKLHSDEFEEPVPLAVINTAGAEDSPFIPSGKKEMYFVFVKDVREPVEIQIRDFVNGIWKSEFKDGSWQEPELVLLQKPGKLALNGCTFVSGDKMLFCTAREGYTGMHWFGAKLKDGKWIDWQKVDFKPEYEVGELHIYHDEIYYHSQRPGGKGKSDIWVSKIIDDELTEPENVEAVNTAESEGMPYISDDGSELWFNRMYLGNPAVFRSKRINGEWTEPELIVSQFAGEPTLDWDGNLYFVHHYYRDGKMIEADIYVAYKK